MKKLNLYIIFLGLTLLWTFGVAAPTQIYAQTQNGTCFSLTSASFTYTQNFDTLANTGTSSTLPPGIVFSETASGDTFYTADDGSSMTADTYSYGTTGSTERALGELTGVLNSRLGACFTNDTGATLNITIYVSYTGEQWRKGNATGDKFDFSYKQNANPDPSAVALRNDTGITNVDALDFNSPNATATNNTALDGNAAGNRTQKGFEAITVSIPSTAGSNALLLRWISANPGGNDDGLAIDNLIVTTTAPTAASVNISGRVLGNGIGLSGAHITMTDLSGNTRYALSSPFGYYRFTNVAAGETYIFNVRHKRFDFQPRTVNLVEQMENLDFDAVSKSDDAENATTTKSP